jgi:tetratricopeptide (TPR) repeat protein
MHGRQHLGIALLAAAAVLAAAAAPARAVTPDQQAAAKAAFVDGERSFELGKFEDAIAAYERAFGLDPQPAFVFNIALAHRRQYELDGKLEHLLRARELYRNYLRLDPESPRRAGVEKILADLTARIDQAGSARPAAPPPPAGAPPPLDVRVPAPPPERKPPPSFAPGPPPAPPERHESHGAWFVVGGLVVLGAVVVVLAAAHERQSPSFDGPPVDLRPR